MGPIGCSRRIPIRLKLAVRCELNATAIFSLPLNPWLCAATEVVAPPSVAGIRGDYMMPRRNSGDAKSEVSSIAMPITPAMAGGVSIATRTS